MRPDVNALANLISTKRRACQGSLKSTLTTFTGLLSEKIHRRFRLHNNIYELEHSTCAADKFFLPCRISPYRSRVWIDAEVRS